jgi:hypothetical protein
MTSPPNASGVDVRSPQAPPWRTGALGACALAALATAWGGALEASVGGQEPTPPALRPSAVTCTNTDDAALHAAELERRAATKIERYPFAAGGGVEAIDLLVEAAQCLRAAGDTPGHERVRRRLDGWLARVERDYVDHRLRLARARQTDRAADALHECRALLTLLAPRNAPYVAWLRRLSLELESDLQPRETR